jgi:hypothetical protein
LLKDWKEKHHEFCQEDAEERKLKRDSKGRVEAGLKELEVGMKESLKMVDNHPSGEEVHSEVKQDLVAVKELCEKMGRKGKGKARKTDVGNSKEGRGAK